MRANLRSASGWHETPARGHVRKIHKSTGSACNGHADLNCPRKTHGAFRRRPRLVSNHLRAFALFCWNVIGFTLLCLPTAYSGEAASGGAYVQISRAHPSRSGPLPRLVRSFNWLHMSRFASKSRALNQALFRHAYSCNFGLQSLERALGFEVAFDRSKKAHACLGEGFGLLTLFCDCDVTA
jgi:hypothetical protein